MDATNCVSCFLNLNFFETKVLAAFNQNAIIFQQKMPSPTLRK
jgi:hypothetical protein